MLVKVREGATAEDQAVASLHGPSFHQKQLSGAVVPHHDPACAGPGIPNASAGNDCALSSGLLDRVKAGEP